MERRRDEVLALEDRIEITVTAEGLRIELLETAKNSFFAVGSSDLLPETVQILAVISPELGKLGNPVALAGHTVPALTTLRMPSREIVGEGLDIAIELSRSPGQRAAHSVKVIPPELIVRQSTAPPR